MSDPQSPEFRREWERWSKRADDAVERINMSRIAPVRPVVFASPWRWHLEIGRFRMGWLKR